MHGDQMAAVRMTGCGDLQATGALREADDHELIGAELVEALKGYRCVSVVHRTLVCGSRRRNSGSPVTTGTFSAFAVAAANASA